MLDWKLWTLFKAKSFIVGRLSTDHGSEQIFFSEMEVPRSYVVLDWLSQAPPSTTRVTSGQCGTIRERRHLEGWLRAFLNVEKQDLIERFSNETKSFETIVLVNKQRSELNIVFRLRTAGNKGCTEYRVSVLKIDYDEFFCVE